MYVIILTLVLFALTATVLISETVGAKSLYVIADINAPTNIPIEAYDIQSAPIYLFHQNTTHIPDRDGGAVGLAIDSDSGYLFATFEFSNVVDLINGTTMNVIGQVTAPGAINLAGIVVDHDKSLVYTVDRYTDNFYVYDWISSPPTLTLKSGFPIDLPNATGLYGVALDETNDIIYVADGDSDSYAGRVRYYDTATFTEQGSFQVSHCPIGIAVDVSQQVVYTVAGFTSSNLLSKYDLATSNEQTVNMGHGGMGVAVDPASNLVYVTGGYYGDDISVWDTSVTPFTQLYTTGNLGGDPTGLCIPGKDVSYNPLNLGKDDGIPVDGCVSPGATFTYNITFDNTFNNFVVTNVILNDTLPVEVNFVSATDGGVYDAGTHTIEWNIGTLAAGAPQDSVEVTVQVNAPGGTVISNSVIIIDSREIPTTKTETTLVCVSTDTTPPVTTKTVGDPKYGPNDEWVRDFTEFNMTATDDDSGVDATYYRVWYLGNWGSWIKYDGNFTLCGNCKHYIEFYSVDNAGNPEAIQNQTHYVDNTMPEQTYEFGNPKNEINIPGFVGIGPNTPIWLNSTDLGDCAVGSEYLTYEIWYGDELTVETVYDGDPINDTNGEFGKISVVLDEWETCCHEIHFWCKDYLGNGDGFTAFDFWVDAEGPTTNSEFGDSHVIEVTGFIWNWTWVNYTTIKFINATDIGCGETEYENAMIGVERIEWAVHLDADCDGVYEQEFFRQGVVYDNDENDTNDDVGVISMELSLYEDCCHIINHTAYDYFGNKQPFDPFETKQHVKVDGTKPTIFKTVGDPNCTFCPGCGEDDYCVRTDTNISFYAEDYGCLWQFPEEHKGVGLDYVKYRIHNGTAWSSWVNDSGLDGEWFYFTEECKHYLEIVAVDLLGNTEIDNETFFVDDTSPKITKTVGDPNIQFFYWGANCEANWPRDPQGGSVQQRYPSDVNLWTGDNYYQDIYGAPIQSWDESDFSKDEFEVDMTREFIGDTVKWTFDYDGISGRWSSGVQLVIGDGTDPLFLVGVNGHESQTPFYKAYSSGWGGVQPLPLGITMVGVYNETHYEIVIPMSYLQIFPDYWIDCDTIITIDAKDQGCCGNLTYVGYNINDTGWVIIPLNQLPKQIPYLPSCVHTLDIKAVDCLGNTAYDNETFYVDCDGPEIIKTVGDPNCTACPDCELGDYCVKTDTVISFYAEDRGCQGGVGLDEVKYHIWNESQGWGGWSYDFTLDGEFITFGEECMHYLEIVATDLLGNVEVDNETFFVDDTPPNITKKVGNPNISINQPNMGPSKAIVVMPTILDYWVNCSTPITINATDEGCCDSLAEVAYNINKTGWTLIPLGQLPFIYYFPEDCLHTLDIRAKDCLGNTAYHNETFLVDCTPPDSTKSICGPHYPASDEDKTKFGLLEGDEVDYFWVRDNDTEIKIWAEEITEPEECDVGIDYLNVTLLWDSTGDDVIDTTLWSINVYDGDDANDSDGDIGQIRYVFKIMEDCLHEIRWYAVDKLGNKEDVHSQLHRVDSTPPQSEKTFYGSTYHEDLNQNGTIEPEEEHYWLTSDTWINITAIDHKDPCAVGVKGFCVKVYWDSDCDGVAETEVYNQSIDDPFSVNFTLMQINGDKEGLYMICWNSTDLLGNEEPWTCQEHKVDNTAPHVIILKPVDGWYSDGSSIPSVVLSEDLPNPHSVCGTAAGIEDGKQGGAWLIDVFPVFNVIPLDATNFKYDAASHEFIGNLVIPDPSGIPDGVVLFVANASDNLGNNGNSLLEILHAYFIQAMLTDTPFEIFGDLIADFIADQNIVWIGMDNTPPAVTINEPVEDEWVGPDMIDISADMSDVLSGITPGSTCYVTLNGIMLGTLPYNVGECDGILLIPSSMPGGEDLPLEVSVYDVAGNKGSAEILVNLIDQTTGYIPTVRFVNLANDTTHEGTINIIIEAHDEETDDGILEVVVRVNRQNDPPFLYEATYDYGLSNFTLEFDISKYQDGARLELQAFATDEDYNSGSTVPIICWVQSTIVYDQWMQNGWNTLDLPLGTVTCNHSLERALVSIDGSYDTVFHFNGTKSKWEGYDIDAPPIVNDLEHILAGKLYFINITKAGGIRFYTDIYPPNVIIDDPTHNNNICELTNISGTASDGETDVESIGIYIMNNETGEYWTESDWGSQTLLECIGTTSWYYNSTGVKWSCGHNYTITAIATDLAGCHGSTMTSFFMMGNNISGTVYLNESITIESGDTLLVIYGNYDEWPPSGPEDFLIAENITDPVMPYSYNFEVFYGSYYVAALLVNISGGSPYAAGAAYNITPEDLFNISIGPDEIVVACADVPDQDIMLYLTTEEEKV